jgi:tetratricopeptide (TPR) repeat protein
MSRSWALIAVLLVTAPGAADDKDWTGKTIKLKHDNLKMGSKFGGGLVRDGAALEKGRSYVVKSDDGSFLELVGQAGFIFKLEAEVVAGGEVVKKDAPAAKVNEKNLWPADTKVLPKKRPGEIRFGDRDRTGKEVFFELSGIMPMLVRKDPGDGWIRIHDGHREGWVRKDDLVTREDAPAYWDKAVKANPKDTWALYMRGNGWWQQGEPDRAIKDFDECVRLDPADSRAFNSRGNAWRDKKEYDKAVADFTKAIRLDPNFSIAYHNRGLVWRDKKEYDRAIADFTATIRLDQEYAPAFMTRGLSWANKKEYDKAVADFTTAIRLDPMDANVHVSRGSAHYYRKDYEGALADYHRALELDPKCTSAVGHMALLLAKLKKYEDAVKWFERAMTVDPVARPHRDYALFLATCPDARYRNGKKAVELAEKALEKAGTGADWEFRAALAAARAEAGDFERAVAEQQKALEDKTLDKVDRKKMEVRLDLYRAKKPFRDEE